jgi:hypothetical protein
LELTTSGDAVVVQRVPGGHTIVEPGDQVISVENCMVHGKDWTEVRDVLAEHTPSASNPLKLLLLMKGEIAPCRFEGPIICNRPVIEPITWSNFEEREEGLKETGSEFSEGSSAESQIAALEEGIDDQYLQKLEGQLEAALRENQRLRTHLGEELMETGSEFSDGSSAEAGSYEWLPTYSASSTDSSEVSLPLYGVFVASDSVGSSPAQQPTNAHIMEIVGRLQEHMEVITGQQDDDIREKMDKREAQARSEKLEALLEKGEAQARCDKLEAIAEMNKREATAQARLEKLEAKAKCMARFALNPAEIHITLQRHARGFLGRQQCKRTRRHITLQRLVRGFLGRQQCERTRRQSEALMVQYGVSTMGEARRKALMAQYGASTIFEALLARREEAEALRNEEQSWLRTHCWQRTEVFFGVASN